MANARHALNEARRPKYVAQRHNVAMREKGAIEEFLTQRMDEVTTVTERFFIVSRTRAAKTLRAPARIYKASGSICCCVLL